MLEDSKLSLKAKGFIAFCLSKNPQWQFPISYICDELKEDQENIKLIINECIELGYAHQDPHKEGSWSETFISDSKEEIKKLRLEKRWS